MPSLIHTDYYIKNTVSDPSIGNPVERVYAGLVIPPNTSRRIRKSDVRVLQQDHVFESDLLSNLVIITYVNPHSGNSVDLLNLDGIDAVRHLGTTRGFQSIVFQRNGLISLPQLNTPLGPLDPGGVWLKVSNLSCDVSPPAVHLSPKSFSDLKLVVSWSGVIQIQDSVDLCIYMRHDQNSPWVEVSCVNLTGSSILNSSVDLSVYDLGNKAQIAVRMVQGVVEDIFCTIVVSG